MDPNKNKIPARSINLLDLITYENNSDLSLYGDCFNEAMRMQPPVYYSSWNQVSQDVQVDCLKLRAGDPFMISMYDLCNNPNEWIDPHKFIPERF